MKLDSSSCTDCVSYQTKHANLKLNIFPDRKVIDGTVEYTLNVTNPISTIKLDVKDIEVKECMISDTSSDFSFESNGDLGMCLSIVSKTELQVGKVQLKIVFSTKPTSTALQWLPKELTQMKQLPFFFSQCQAIHARALIPCQDTPSVKFTYDAIVEAPKDFTILLGSTRNGERKVNNEMGTAVHNFKQSVPIPAYLIAIAGGLIEGKQIGPRSTVWSEPCILQACHDEFAETCEKFLSDAESLCGPYKWKIYDILVLPPTFPYGGMENPCLTFVTPTLITGDKSMVNVIAHEISHSWTGNLVTNCDWSDFWLNEGHTNYLERLILEKLYGFEERNLHINIGIEELKESIEQFGPNHEFTKLVPTLGKTHPDDCYSRVPYEKGSLLLYNLEKKLGKEAMLKWLKAYINKFQSMSIDTSTWLNFFKEYHGNEKLRDFDFDKWFYSTGMINTDNVEVGDLVKKCREFGKIITSEEFNSNKKLQEDFKTWLKTAGPKSIEYLLREACSNFKQMSDEQLSLIEEISGFKKSPNVRIKFGFAKLSLLNKSKSNVDFVLEFLNSQGVMKYCRPLYRLLGEWPEMRERAIKNYNEKASEMHPVTADILKKDLKI